MSSIQTSLFEQKLIGGKKIVEVKLGIKPYFPNALRAYLKDRGVKVRERADRMMQSNDFTIEDKVRVAQTVEVHTRDLGFGNQGGTLEEVYQKAEENELFRCLPEIGPRRILLPSCPLPSTYLFIAMQPIKVRGRLYIFKLWNFNFEPWLDVKEIKKDTRINGPVLFSLD